MDFSRFQLQNYAYHVNYYESVNSSSTWLKTQVKLQQTEHILLASRKRPSSKMNECAIHRSGRPVLRNGLVHIPSRSHATSSSSLFGLLVSTALVAAADKR